MKSPDYFSLRKSILYSVAALGGSLAAHELFLPESQPTMGLIIGVIMGANIGAFIPINSFNN